jgi:hypothetical protein
MSRQDQFIPHLVVSDGLAALKFNRQLEAPTDLQTRAAAKNSSQKSNIPQDELAESVFDFRKPLRSFFFADSPLPYRESTVKPRFLSVSHSLLR